MYTRICMVCLFVIGTLPSELSALTDLVDIQFFHNKMTGKSSMSIDCVFSVQFVSMFVRFLDILIGHFCRNIAH